MKKNRVDAVLKNLEQMGLSQMLITDPLAIFYLTGRLIQPLERFYGLYLNQNGGDGAGGPWSGKGSVYRY